MTENRSGNEGITHANLVTHFNFRIQHMKIVLDSHYFCICIAHYYFSADLAYFSKSFFRMIHQTCREKGVYNCKEHLRTIVNVKSCKTCVTNEKKENTMNRIFTKTRLKVSINCARQY